MLQIYFLSVLCNGLAGFVFLYGDSFGVDSKRPPIGGSFSLILGIAAAITGILKLLSPVRYLIIGDLLPAVAGLVAGFMLIFGYLESRGSMSGGDKVGQTGNALLKRKKAVGIGCLAVAALHFLFPAALFI
ncbi:MAG: hypothetical protein FWE09_03100 [Treponema sp.]|nr:hypothetical protein [Treponema sp.]